MRKAEEGNGKSECGSRKLEVGNKKVELGMRNAEGEKDLRNDRQKIEGLIPPSEFW